MPTIKSYGRRFEVGVSAKLLMPGDDCGAFTVTGSPKQGPDGYDVPVRWHNNDREGTYSSYLGERFMVLRSREDLPVTPVYEATAQQTALDWNLAVLADAIAEMDLAWRERDYAKQAEIRTRKADPALEAPRVITDSADAICGALVLAAANTRPGLAPRSRERLATQREALELITDYRNGTRGL